MMATLLLRLAAPMQSWGMDSKFETRKTGREPTKSGVIGLIAAALGVKRDDQAALERLNCLRFGVRVDQEGKLLSDYHTAKKEGKNKSENTSYVTRRYYLADAIFLVGLESDDIALLQELKSALQTPAFSLFLGRRSCPPTFPLCLGIRQNSLEQTLREEPSLLPKWKKRTAVSMRFVLDAAPHELGSTYRQDLPISFSPLHRQFGYRNAKESMVMVPQTEPTTEHDPFIELGGD